MKLTDIIYAKTGITIDLTSLASDPEGQTLVTALMVLVAKSDGRISREETIRMVEMLQDRFHFASEDAVSLVNRAVTEFRTHADIDGLMVNINEELSLPQKENLMSMALHIISADDQKDAKEMQLLNALIEGMKIPDNIMEKVYQQYFRESKERG